MVFFITLLRAIAACLITNAHYTGIYPTDLIANGGLIGDIIFFAVSGYCLYNVKGNFVRWYSKRLVRCYLPVLLITALYMLIGAYSLSEHSVLWWYMYPTYYHFVASIVVLYIPFYIIMKIEALRKRIPYIMLALFAICMALYFTVYDRSYYHIDTVREPMIRLLFMESMLLGAWFKRRGEAVMSGFKWKYLLGTVGCALLYFASKLAFSRYPALSQLQIVNWFAIFALLYFVFALFASMDKSYQKWPGWIKAAIAYLAAITLEIYVVQYVIIDWIRPLLPFPINWIALTASILIAASALHFVCQYVLRGVDALIKPKKEPKS